MKVKIERITHSALRNEEFAVAYGLVIRICEQHDMDRLHLRKSYDELLLFRSIEELPVLLRKNEKLAQASRLDDERDALINSLARVVKSYHGVDAPDVTPHVELLEALLEKHEANGIASAARSLETDRLKKLEKEIAGDPALQNAVAAMRLQSVVNRLFEANREYETVFLEYLAENNGNPPDNISLLRTECAKSLTHFFNAVQYSAYLHEDADYMPFVNALNKLQRYYKQQLKARATRRRNGKKTEEEPPIPPMENEQ
ncbi:MAG: DUF6261 family protein [Bacteroidales bacterium]|jgi:hypothetical protein|nr:DUF6261 family protein [Bacteroidales bacterium]